MSYLFKMLFFSVILLFVSIKTRSQSGRKNEHSSKETHRVNPMDTIKSVLGNDVQMRKVNYIWNELIDKSGKNLGYVFYTEKYITDIIGYNGITPLLVLLDGKKQIVNIWLINSVESSGFIRKMNRKGFFNKWKGKRIDECKKMKVDVISGATITSTAIIRTMHSLSNKAVESIP